MGFLCAAGPMLPNVWNDLERFASARRRASIGTLCFRRQCKRAARLGFSLALGISCAVPGAAYAAGSTAAPAESDLPAPPRAPRGESLHDGFYLRMGVGVGLGGSLVSSDSKAIGDYSFGGGA